jgi:hypothetical protein
MTNPSEPDRLWVDGHQVEVEDSCREVRRVCYARGGAHGPQRRAAKADLKEASLRSQRITERGRDLHARTGPVKQVG